MTDRSSSDAPRIGSPTRLAGPYSKDIVNELRDVIRRLDYLDYPLCELVEPGLEEYLGSAEAEEEFSDYLAGALFDLGIALDMIDPSPVAA
jgi:hypothetical protein